MRIDAIKSVRNENTLKKSDKVCYSHKRVENIEAQPKLELIFIRCLMALKYK